MRENLRVRARPAGPGARGLGRPLLMLEMHGRILEAIVQSAKELLHSRNVAHSIPKVLELIGRATAVERVHLLVVDSAGLPGSHPVVGHYLWMAPDISTPTLFADASNLNLADIGLKSWLPRLMRGETIVGNSRDFEDAARKLLQAAGILSTVAVPVFVDNRWWGFIAFDACKDEREWLPADTDTFKILAELVGVTVARAQRQQSLADADRIIESSPATIYRMGPQEPFPLIFLSQNIRRYGYEADALLAAPALWPAIIEGEDAPAIMANLKSIASGKADYVRTEFRLKTPDGAIVWFDGHTNALRDDAGRLIALEGIIADVTARKASERQLLLSNILLTTTVESSPDAILVVDRNARITSFNRRFVDLWGIPQGVVDSGNDEPVLDLVSSRIRNEAEFLARVRFLYANPEMESRDEFETKDGRTIDRHSVSLYGPSKDYLGRIWFFRDISERKTVEQQMVRLARTDSLTDLPNRIAFLERLQLAFARAKRGGNGFAIHYLDLDHFKDVNDTLGHPAGDALLQAVAARLKHCVRDVDLVSRFGGDEFAVLQEEVTDISGIEALANKIGESLSLPFLIGVNQVHSSASIGIVQYDADIEEPEAMLTKADLALYRAKDKGRNQYRFHVAELDQQAQERMTVGRDLHLALGRGEFELFYQPQVDLVSGRIVGVEALIRWNHPVRGQLPPSAFLPVAESNGTILPIGRWVLEQSCRQMRLWRDLGIAPAVMAVNVTAAQFQLAGELDQTIAAVLKEYGLAPDELELELTESALMEATQRHQDLFGRLREIGVRIAIDDFGTGFSSFAYLCSFRVSRLKLAMEFIQDVASNPGNAAIVRAIIGLAHELGIGLIAEGVNTAEQRAFLLAAGCRYAQGYSFGEPAGADRVTELLRHNPQPTE